MVLLLSVPLACESPPSEPAGTVEGSSIDPAPWTYDDADEELPPVDPDPLGRALDEAIRGILSYDAGPVLDGYQLFVDRNADPDCPRMTFDPYGNSYWADGCTSTDGTFFGGYLSQYFYTGLYADGITYDGSELAGNVVLSGPDGTFDLEGYASSLTGLSADGFVEVAQSVLVGGFSHDGPDAVGWLLEETGGVSVDATLIGYTVEVLGGKAVIVDGSLPVEVDGDTYSVVFEFAQLGNPALGTLCGDEPGGTILIRDPYGRWGEVTFHGPDLAYGSSAGDPERCDGCGDLVVDGEPAGNVCASFDPWYSWERIR